MEREYRNIGYIFLLLIPMAIFGFYKSYIIRSPEITVTIDGYIHLHAAISSLWIGLLISQPLLIRSKRYRIHRLFGRMSYIVFPLLILTFGILTIRKYNGISSVIHPVFDAVLLLVFYLLAIKNRRNMAIHMRYMIASALIFIGPTLARILFHWTDINRFWGTMVTWGSINLILIALVIWDKNNQRNYQPYLVALSGFFVYLTVLFFINY